MTHQNNPWADAVKSGQKGRINFDNIYAIGREFHADTRLALAATGYNASSGKFEDMRECSRLSRVTTR